MFNRNRLAATKCLAGAATQTSAGSVRKSWILEHLTSTSTIEIQDASTAYLRESPWTMKVISLQTLMVIYEL